MKKTNLVLFPVLAALLLAGCTATKKSGKKKKSSSGSETSQTTGGKSTSGGGGGGSSSASKSEASKDPVVLTEDLTINKAVIVAASGLTDKYTYPKNPYSFTLGSQSIKFDANASVGQKTSNNREGGTSYGDYYYEQGLMQWKKSEGQITVAQPVVASKITIHWFNTYATEGATYQPAVLVGDSAGSITTDVPANERDSSGSVSGTKTGGKEDSVKTDSTTGEETHTDRDVYSYATTYDISGKNYFAVKAAGGATYIKDIIIHK